MKKIMGQKSYMAKEQDINRKWYLIDAEGKVLGRLASQITKILQGKNKPIYTPHMDTGDYVIVINAENINLTGAKATRKNYYDHSQYPGGLKVRNIQQIREKHPERILKDAVKGMMPKTNLSRKMLRKLKIYVGSEHPHQAQKPEKTDIQ